MDEINCEVASHIFGAKCAYFRRTYTKLTSCKVRYRCYLWDRRFALYWQWHQRTNGRTIGIVQLVRRGFGLVHRITHRLANNLSHIYREISGFLTNCWFKFPTRHTWSEVFAPPATSRGFPLPARGFARIYYPACVWKKCYCAVCCEHLKRLRFFSKELILFHGIMTYCNDEDTVVQTCSLGLEIIWRYRS